MNITVYLGANEGNDPRLRKSVEELGTWIGSSGKTSGGRHPRKSSTKSCSGTSSGALSAAGPRNRARNFTFRR